MKMMLSTPRTISRNVSVARAIQICGSVNDGIEPLIMLAVGPRREHQLYWRRVRCCDALATWPRSRSHAKELGVPRQPELGRRRHVAEQRRGGDDGGAGEVAFAAESHAVLPVAVERRDRALARRRARPAPGRSTGRTTTGGSRRRPIGTPRRSTRRRAADRAARSAGRRRPIPGKIANSRSTLRRRPAPRAARSTSAACSRSS